MQLRAVLENTLVGLHSIGETRQDMKMGDTITAEMGKEDRMNSRSGQPVPASSR